MLDDELYTPTCAHVCVRMNVCVCVYKYYMLSRVNIIYYDIKLGIQ